MSGIYTDGLLAIEAYKKQIVPLREEESDIRQQLNKLKLSLVERERTEDYMRMLKSVVNHFDFINEKMDLAGKKGLLKLIFKSVQVDLCRIKKYEIYEPFKSLYEGAKIKWQTQARQQVAKRDLCVSTLLPTDVR